MPNYRVRTPRVSVRGLAIFAVSTLPVACFPLLAAVALIDGVNPVPIWYFWFIVVATLSSMALMVFAIIDVTKRNRSLGRDDKMMWLSFLFFFNVIVLPVYIWRYHVRRASDRSP